MRRLTLTTIAAMLTYHLVAMVVNRRFGMALVDTLALMVMWVGVWKCWGEWRAERRT